MDKVQINPSHIIDFFRLGNSNKINLDHLIKLLCTIDVNAILANKRSLLSPLIIKPDMSLQERETESTLLKERWSLLRAGHSRKQSNLVTNTSTSMANYTW